MAAEPKARPQAKIDADAIRAAGRADAARSIKCAEAERQAILTDATYRAGLIVREAEATASHDAARIHKEALEDAKRIREEAVEEIVKVMSTLTTERDHILADARDDARRIVEAARQEREAAAHTESSQGRSASRDHLASPEELDELFFAGAPEPAPLDQPRPLERRRRKRFRRHH